jgi:hypothetical protein
MMLCPQLKCGSYRSVVVTTSVVMSLNPFLIPVPVGTGNVPIFEISISIFEVFSGLLHLHGLTLYFNTSLRVVVGHVRLLPPKLCHDDDINNFRGGLDTVPPNRRIYVQRFCLL